MVSEAIDKESVGLLDVLLSLPLGVWEKCFSEYWNSAYKVSSLSWKDRKAIAGLRAACQGTRDWCNLLIQDIEIRLGTNSSDTEQQITWLQQFSRLKSLKIQKAGWTPVTTGVAEVDVTHWMECSVQKHLSLFLSLWEAHHKFVIKRLTLRDWCFSAATCTQVAKAMPGLAHLSLQGCAVLEGCALEPLVACTNLVSIKVRAEYDCRDYPNHLHPLRFLCDAIRTLSALALLKELNVIISLHYLTNVVDEGNRDFLASARSASMFTSLTQLTKLSFVADCLLDLLELQKLSSLQHLEICDRAHDFDEAHDQQYEPYEQLAAAIRVMPDLKKLHFPELTQHMWLAVADSNIEHLSTYKFNMPEHVPLPKAANLRVLEVDNVAFESAWALLANILTAMHPAGKIAGEPVRGILNLDASTTPDDALRDIHVVADAAAAGRIDLWVVDMHGNNQPGYGVQWWKQLPVVPTVVSLRLEEMNDLSNDCAPELTRVFPAIRSLSLYKCAGYHNGWQYSAAGKYFLSKVAPISALHADAGPY